MKFVAEIAELKAQAGRYHKCAFNGSGYVTEQLRHSAGSPEVPLTINGKEAPGTVEFLVIPDGRAEVQNLSVVLGGIAYTIRRDH